MKIRHILYGLLGCAVLFTACDNISEGDRLIAVEENPVTPPDSGETEKPVVMPRWVLVEEFSGQMCVNCPYGAAQLHELQSEYGADTLIVVTIHSGIQEGFGFHVSDGGLATDEGEQLFASQGRPAQPAMVVDRRGGTVARDDASKPTDKSKKWLTAVVNAFKVSAVVKLDATAAYNKESNQVQVKVDALSEDAMDCKLCVWIIEDNIVGFQKYPDKYDMEYVHNNIFRKAVNPLNGDDVHLTGDMDNPTSREYSIALYESWNVQNLSVVAFVYDNTGVCQTTRAKVDVPLAE